MTPEDQSQLAEQILLLQRRIESLEKIVTVLQEQASDAIFWRQEARLRGLRSDVESSRVRMEILGTLKRLCEPVETERFFPEKT